MLVFTFSCILLFIVICSFVIVFWNTLSLRSPLNVRDHISQPYSTTGNITVNTHWSELGLNPRTPDKKTIIWIIETWRKSGSVGLKVDHIGCRHNKQVYSNRSITDNWVKLYWTVVCREVSAHLCWPWADRRPAPARERLPGDASCLSLHYFMPSYIVSWFPHLVSATTVWTSSLEPTQFF